MRSLKRISSPVYPPRFLCDKKELPFIISARTTETRKSFDKFIVRVILRMIIFSIYICLPDSCKHAPIVDMDIKMGVLYGKQMVEVAVKLSRYNTCNKKFKKSNTKFLRKHIFTTFVLFSLGLSNILGREVPDSM